MFRPASVFLVALLLQACAATPPDTREAIREVAGNLDAVLWFQTSAEYRGNSIGLFAAASGQLDELIAQPGVTADLEQAAESGCEAGRSCPALAEQRLLPAVVLDVDETVLDNSPYQARLAKFGGSYDPQTWDAWIAERSAAAVPGAVAFIEAARKAGFAIVYVTNRTCAPRLGDPSACPQKQDTQVNLVDAGFPPRGANDRLILRNEKPEWNQSEKRLRRAHVAESYRIAMLIGDDLGDLGSDIKAGSMAERDAFVQQHAHLYGRVWFQLTNPLYGSWSRVIAEPRSASLNTGQ